MIRYFLALVILSVFTLSGLSACAAPYAGDQTVLTIETAQGPRVFNIEIARFPEEQKQGLMNRKSLPADSGMLFLFADEVQRAFWMKNTLIPLDMLFIAKDGEIHHIHHNAKPLDETRITSERPAMAVLEINGGLSESLGITQGDKVIHPAFKNQLD